MSWKQYGGTTNFETNKQITTNTIITDEIVLKKSYVGGFTIRGILDVTGKALIQGDLELSGIFNVSDISVNILKSDTNYFNTINSVNSIHCIGNTIIDNTLTSNNILVNNIKIENLINFKGNKFIYSDLSGIGFNTLYPNATIDICCTSIEGLNIYSDFSDNINIITSNKQRNGIVVSTLKDTNSKAVINFYVNNPIDTSNNGDAYIHYDDSSILELHSSDKIVSSSNFYITNRANNNIYNESLVVYDNSSGIYNYDIYKNPTAITGDGITIVTNDNSSNSFLRMVTPNGSGLGIVGGAYPNDVNRSMTSIGITDSCGNFIPNQTIVSSSIKGKYKTTMGINTYKPNTEKYVVDINGPLHIDNGDVNFVNMSHFEILSMDSKDNFTVAVGSSIDVSSSIYTNIVLVSYDYGSSFISRDLSGITISSGGGLSLNDIKIGTINGLNYTLNSVYVYDNNRAIIVGNNNLILFTIDSGQTWRSIDFFPPIRIDYNFKQIVVSKDVDNSERLIFYIYGESLNKNSFLKCYVSKNIRDQNFYENYIRDISNNIIVRNFDIYYIDEVKSKVYFATNNGIWYMNLYNDNDSNNNDISQNKIIQADTSLNNIDLIKIYGSSLITLSTNSVSNSTVSDISGVSNFQLYTNSYNLSKLYIYDSLNYLSISSNKQLFYTNNAGKTWSKIPDYFYNSSGKESLVNDISNTSQILMSNNNTILISDVRQTYKQYIRPGNTNIINLFVPKLFNSVHNNVLDVCGNMNITGSIYIQEGGLRSNNNAFYLLNENVSNLNIGADATVINIGNKISGNTNIYTNFYVDKNSILNGNVLVNGIQTISNVRDSTDISNGALIVQGGVGIYGNTNVGGNLVIKKNSQFIGNVLVDGIQTISNVRDSTDISNGALVVQGGVGIFGNTNIGGNLVIQKNGQLIGNVLVDGIQTISNTTESTDISNGALIVKGGVGILGNTNVGGNLVIQKNGQLIGNVLVDGIQTISNTTESTDISNGALIVKGGVGILGNTNIGGNLIIQKNSQLIGNVLVDGIQTISNTTESTGTTNGSLVVQGGVGILGNTNVGGNLVIQKNGQLIGNVLVDGIQTISNVRDSTDISNGALVVQGGVGIFGNTNIGGNLVIQKNGQLIGNVLVDGIQTISNTTESTDISNGALIVKGGVGILRNTNIGGNLVIQKNSQLIGNVLVDGIQTISNSTESNGTTTGSLVVQGGVGILGNTNIGGNLVIQKNSQLIGNVLVDGIQTISNTIESTGTTNGALIVQGGVGILRNTNVGGNLIIQKNSTLVGNVSVNGIQTISNSTESNGIDNGAFVVQGGVGILGNTNVGGNLIIQKNSTLVGNVSVNGIQTISNSTESNGIDNGAFVVQGGIGILGNTNVGGNLVIQKNSQLIGNVLVNGIQTISNSTESNGITTGSLVVQGGVGILRNTNIGGNLNVNNDVSLNNNLYVNKNSVFNGNVLFNSIQTIGNTNESNSTSTGALIINGGVGINGNTNIGGNLLVNNRTIFTGNLNIRSTDIQSIHTLGGIFSTKTIESAQDILLTGNIVNKTFSSTNDTIPIQFSDLKYISDVFVRKNMDNLIDDISGQKNFKGIINIQNPTDSSTTSGALFVSGGVGIQKQLVVNGNITSNGVLTTNNTLITNGNIVSWSNVGIGKIQDSNYKLDVLGDINVNGIIHATNINYDNLLNIYSNNTNGILIIGRAPSTTNTQVIKIGESTKRISIGASDTTGTGSVLNLGGGIDNYSLGNGIDEIYVGGAKSKVTFSGNVKFMQTSINLTSIIQYSKNFILEGGTTPYAVSNLYNNNLVNGGGILFAGFSDISAVTDLGSFLISNDGQAYIFKPPTYNSLTDYNNDVGKTQRNILRLDVNNLKTTANNAIVILKPSPINNGAYIDDDGSKFTMTATNFDISNIFIKDNDEINTGTTQSISTDVINKGNVYFNKNVNINTSNFINNCALNVNGNTIVSRLGIGTSSVNTNPNSLEVQGNVYQLNNGYIYQF
jgi:hypothetical protein